MSDQEKPKDITGQLKLLRGGKADEPMPAPREEFAHRSFIESFMVDDEPFDFSKLEIDPSLYGKTVGGVTYGDPTKAPVILYIDDKGQPVFDL